jgi:hypothetical protein
MSAAKGLFRRTIVLSVLAASTLTAVPAFAARPVAGAAADPIRPFADPIRPFADPIRPF